MAEMNGNIGEVTVTVKVGMEASEQFDAVARMLGYVKERTCQDMLKDCYSPDMECSECRTRWYVGSMTNGEWNYCPNCGAQVVEVE